MSVRKQQALQQMAARGGSVNEKVVALKKLNAVPAIFDQSEERADVWSADGQLTRNRGGLKSYISGVKLAHFLEFVQDGKIFTYKSIPFTETYGTGDFYTILSFGVKLGAIDKIGSTYLMKSRNTIKKAFNEHLENSKIK